MKKLNVFLLVFIGILGLHSNVFAQTRIYPDLAVTINAKVPGNDSISDYAVQFSYSSCGSVNCKYYRRHNLRIYKDGDADANIIYTETEDTHKTTFSYTLPVGPGSNHRYGLRYREYSHAVYSCDDYSWSGFKYANGAWSPYATPSKTERDNLIAQGLYSVVIRATTAAIRSPKNLVATDQAYFEKIVLSWVKGTNIPDTSVTYRIYRGTTNNPASATYMGEVAGTERTWADNTVAPNEVFYYWVTTYSSKFKNESNNTMINESTRTVQNAVHGLAKTITIKASDGAWPSKVRVDWGDLSSYFTKIKVERSIPNSTGKEQLGLILDGLEQGTDDSYDPIPGYNYTYYVTPMYSGRTFPFYTDQGYRKSNGTITGQVLSQKNAGVDSVHVCAKLISRIPAGAGAVPTSGYCTYTDVNGNYTIHNIYYFDSAEFQVVPYKKGLSLVHDFSPDSTKVELRLDAATASANFTDESVFTIEGKVTYPVSSPGIICGIQGVDIQVNGQTMSITTDQNGTWKYSTQYEGTYSFKPVFGSHKFANTQGQSQTSILVNDNISNVNFTDVTLDSIKIKVQSGCGRGLGNYSTVQVSMDNGCYNQRFNTDSKGLLTVRDLPARIYKVQVVDINPLDQNYLAQIGYKPITVDLTEPDTVTREVDFIYHAPFNVTVDFTESGADTICNTILMQQGKTYKVYFNVIEELGGCPVSDGKLRIHDEVSDRWDSAVEVPIKNGLAIYTVNAGYPLIASSDTHNHEKRLQVTPKTEFLEWPAKYWWIMVTGIKPGVPSFITHSPDFPMLVVHDPPGDSSYAYINKGTTVTTMFNHEVLTGGEGGMYADMTLGYGSITGFRAGGVFKMQATKGSDSLNRDGWKNTITFDEGFSTSPSGGFVGGEGDVFIGASFNESYSLAEKLTFDISTCTPVISIVPTVDLTGYNTTFIYTESFIKNTLIPNYQKLYDATLDGRELDQLLPLDTTAYKQAWEYLVQINNWKDRLADNDTNRTIRAPFERNISFSAGTIYTNEMTTDSIQTSGGEYHEIVNEQFSLGAKIENDKGLWAKYDFGAIGKYRFYENTANVTDSTKRRKVGYVLRDNDNGDYFSVNVKRDVANGVPAFELVSGASSCPYEAETQSRDKAHILIDPAEFYDVPVGGIATFKADLYNYSESGETRQYAIKVISTTNPDGADIKLGGTSINNSPAYYTLDYNVKTSIALTVGKGPVAEKYDRIGILMYPPCKSEPYTSDTAWINVSFLHPCQAATLFKPEDGWVVNQASNNILQVVLTGFNPNDAQLQSITLQYMKEGTGIWNDAVTYPKDSLERIYITRTCNVSTIPDGAYRIRVRTNCQGGITYSPEVKGYIDRASLAPFGYPSPANGFLDLAQEISVSFDKNIDCNLTGATIKLLTDDSTAIPITPQCYGNKIILMPQIDLWEGSIFTGVKFYATVAGIKDASGNIQQYPVYWSFIENRATSGNPFVCPEPAFECPENMIVTADTGFCGASVYYPIQPTADCYAGAVTINHLEGLGSGYFFPTGVTTNTYTMTNSQGLTATCTFMINVVDKEPPMISDLALDYNTVWPPNHTMFPVTVNYTEADNCGIASRQLYVTSNETGKGAGNTPVDIRVLDEHHIELMAGRSGSGNGRYYTINVKIIDLAGNSSVKQAMIFIPHDKGKVKNVEITDQLVSASINPGTGSEAFTAKVWPNPSNNNFNLEVRSLSREKIVVYVSDILGRVVDNLEVSGIPPSTFGEYLEPGMYFITVKQGNNLQNIKVIKQ